MEYTKATTFDVGAQSSCALSTAGTFVGVGTIEAQPQFRPVTRRALMSAINTASRELGLRPASVVVLDALLSCLPCHDAKTGADTAISPLTLLTVFASNDTLCFRAKGITDRQLRRHLERLEQAGLLQRRDSANGKRFPILRGGKVIGAFGLDLSPLLARADEILQLSQRMRDEAVELRGIKAFIQKLRLECLGLALEEDASRFVEATRTVMRRASVTLLQANSILSKLKAILDCGVEAASDVQLTTANAVSCAEDIEETGDDSAETTGSDGQNVRHKETPKSYTKKTNGASMSDLWREMTTIPSFYPTAPDSDHALLQLLFSFGKMLRISEAILARAIQCLGIGQTLLIADQIAEKADRVHCPDSYLLKIITEQVRGKVGHGQPSTKLRMSFPTLANRKPAYEVVRGDCAGC
jgi:replication initiation protein RepC